VLFIIYPGVVKFVSKKWLIGCRLGHSISHSKNNNGNSSSRIYQQGISGNFAATRFYSLADKLFFTCEYKLGVGYSLRDTEFESNSQVTESKNSSMGPIIEVSPGLAYFINDKWMIYSQMGSLAYNYNYNLEVKKRIS
jgi:hypothetical protein